jgi:L-malate glycosyltransferase
LRILFLSHTNNPWTPVWARALVERGHDLQVVSFHPARIPGIDVRFVGVEPFDKYRNKRVYLTRVPQVRRVIREFAPDVVLASYLTSNGLSAALAWRGPLVVSAVGGDVLLHPDHRCWRHPLQPRLVRFVCRRAHGVHVVSRNLERALVRLGVPAERVVRFPVGVDLRRFRPARETPPGPPGIVCTRTHAPVYDVATLLRALTELPGAWHCVLAGGGLLLDAHRRLAAEAGLGERVTFTGPLDHERLPELLREAAVYVSPALSDGASASLLEAMATGLVPVVTRIEANTDWVEQGHNGLLFPPGSEKELAGALRRALEDGALAARARAENPARVAEEADLERCVSRLEALLEEARRAHCGT